MTGAQVMYPAGVVALENAFHSAAIGTNSWSWLLEKLVNRFGAIAGVMYPLDHRRQSVIHTAALDGAVRQYYQEGWIGRNSIAKYYDQLTACKSLIHTDLSPGSDIRDVALWKDLLLPHNLLWPLIVGFEVCGERWAAGFFRAPEAPAFALQDKTIADRISYELSRSARIASHMDANRAAGCLDALTSLSESAVIYTLSGRGTFRITAVSKNARNDPEYVLKNDAIIFDNPELTKRVNAYFAEAASWWRNDRLNPPQTRFIFSGIRTVNLVPLNQCRQAPLHELHVLAVFRNRAKGLASSPEHHIDLWGLTPSEADFLHALFPSFDLAATAQTTGIAIETARARLKSIFRKTGTSKQAELATLVLRSTPFASLAPDYVGG